MEQYSSMQVCHPRLKRHITGPPGGRECLLRQPFQFSSCGGARAAMPPELGCGKEQFDEFGSEAIGGGAATRPTQVIHRLLAERRDLDGRGALGRQVPRNLKPLLSGVHAVGTKVVMAQDLELDLPWRPFSRGE